jgi:hypothetical protein
MALSIGNSVSFTNEVVAPGGVKKIIDLNIYDVQAPRFTNQTPAGIQSGKDDSRWELVFTKKNEGQPANGLGIDPFVYFGSGLTGTAATNIASAYATILAATTPIA